MNFIYLSQADVYINPDNISSMSQTVPLYDKGAPREIRITMNNGNVFIATENDVDEIVNLR